MPENETSVDIATSKPEFSTKKKVDDIDLDYDSVLKDFEDLLNTYDESVFDYDYKNAEGENYLTEPENYATDYDLGFPKVSTDGTEPKWFTELHVNATNNKTNENNHTEQNNNRKTKNVNDNSNNSYRNDTSYLHLCLSILVLIIYDKFSYFIWVYCY